MLLVLLDSSLLGRLDYTNLSQQALMECLVCHFTYESINLFHDEKKNFCSLCEWEGVHLDSDGIVTEIRWVEMSGSIDFHWLPPSLQVFCTECSPCLSGILDFQVLSPSLLSFTLVKTKVTGRIKSPLPKVMHELIVQHGCLAGSLETSFLPATLLIINLGENMFSGSLELADLPDKIEEVYLYSNRFSGSINMDYLPQLLRDLDLQGNFLCGTFSLLFVPETLVHINLSNNLFEMDTVIFSCAHRRLLRVDLRGNEVQSITDTNGEYLVSDKFLY